MANASPTSANACSRSPADGGRASRTPARVRGHGRRYARPGARRGRRAAVPDRRARRPVGVAGDRSREPDGTLGSSPAGRRAVGWERASVDEAREPAADDLPRLVPCEACGRSISTEAAACPQCGHPGAGGPRALPRASLPAAVGSGPPCHACEAPATTRCSRCGTPCCVEHLAAAAVGGRWGSEVALRCADCAGVAERIRRLRVVLTVVVGIVLLSVILSRRSRSPVSPAPGDVPSAPASRPPPK